MSAPPGALTEPRRARLFSRAPTLGRAPAYQDRTRRYLRLATIPFPCERCPPRAVTDDQHTTPTFAGADAAPTDSMASASDPRCVCHSMKDDPCATDLAEASYRTATAASVRAILDRLEAGAYSHSLQSST